MSRHDEIWRLNQLSAEKLTAAAQGRLTVLFHSDALHEHLARNIADTIHEKSDAVVILPYGPTGQYPFLRDIINRERISLRKTRLVFMNEYADASGNVLPTYHPLSVRGGMAWFWEQIDLDLRPAEDNIFFPDKFNIEELPGLIKKAGGVQACFANVGIHGHVGFNEPEAGVRDSTCRLAQLSESSVAVNSISSQVGGDLENFPRHAYTLGLRECLSARRIRLYCLSDAGLDWAKTSLRVAVLGQPDDDYPATWIRRHADWQVITDRATAEPPRHVL